MTAVVVLCLNIIKIPTTYPQMRIVLLFVLLFAVAYSFSFTADVCPHDVEVACVNEVNKGTT